MRIKLLVDGRYLDTGWSSVSGALRIDHLTGGRLYERAVGLARADSDDPMTVDRQYLISSATKMIVAVVVLQLREEGAWGASGLDASLGELGVFSREILDAISVFEGRSYGPDITLRQLLTHTSGLDADWLGVWDDKGQSLPDVMMWHFRCLEGPRCDISTLPTAKQWRPWYPDDPFAEDIALFNSFLAAERASPSARAKPGDAYRYTDVNFWVLGVLIEEMFGKPLHAVLRDRMFDPLEMRETFQSYSADPAEEARNRGLSDFYMGPQMRRSYWEPLDAGAYVEHVGLDYFLTEIGDSVYYVHSGFLGAFSFYDAERQLLFTGTLNKVADKDFFRIIDDISRAVALPSSSER